MLTLVLAIVPVNSPSSAKRRLETLLTPRQRADLVRAMLTDVLDACNRARSVDSVLVVTPDPELCPAGVEALIDPGHGHAAAIAAALGRRPEAGAVVVMADCPLVLPETLDELCDAARPLALCPAQDGGTNALALCPADAIEPVFGVPGGALLNVARAREHGHAAVVIDDPLVALDLDTPEDVRRVLDLGAGTRTHALLDQALSLSAECGARGR